MDRPGAGRLDTGSWVTAHRQHLADRRGQRVSAELAAAEDRLAGLEAEAVLLKGRIRTAADAGNVDAVTKLYRHIPELRLDLLAARMTVARATRRERRQGGENTDLNRYEHTLAELLATLGVEPDLALRRAFG